MCPAKSKSQQRFMGMVHAAQKGELDDPSPEVKKVAKSIKYKDAEDFAKTKHKGLPDKVKEALMNEKFPEDWQFDPKQLDTKKVQVWSRSGTMLTAQMDRKDAQKLVRSRKAFVITGQAIGLFKENKMKEVCKKKVHEGAVDQQLIKQGLKYAKKKYKYNTKDLSYLARELATYMRSGDIDGVPSMEAYIDYRHDPRWDETYQPVIESKERLKEIIREEVRNIISEQNALIRAKEIIKSIFKQNNGKVDPKVYKDIFSKGFLKTHGDRAVKFAWNNFERENKIKKQGNNWVWQGA